jgi:hypothetical protein
LASERNFRSIRLGMHESQVIRLLDQPVQTHSAVPQLSWYYRPSTLRVAHDGGLWDTRGTFDSGLGYTAVTADQAGRVVNASGGFLGIKPNDLVGQRLIDVSKRAIALETLRYSVRSSAREATAG